MSAPDRRTTAQMLGALRNELIAQGFSQETAENIAEMAASEVIRSDQGFSVSDPDAETAQS